MRRVSKKKIRDEGNIFFSYAWNSGNPGAGAGVEYAFELDGSFVGNTPSEVQVAEGDHTVTVKKNGFKEWERKLKVSAGSNVHLNAELEKTSQ